MSEVDQDLDEVERQKAAVEAQRDDAARVHNRLRCGVGAAAEGVWAGGGGGGGKLQLSLMSEHRRGFRSLLLAGVLAADLAAATRWRTCGLSFRRPRKRPSASGRPLRSALPWVSGRAHHARQ